MKKLAGIMVVILCLSVFVVSAYGGKVVVVPLNAKRAVEGFNQPYQYSVYDHYPISSSNTHLSTGLKSEPVPAGKRLFVQYISYQLRSNNIAGQPRCHARVWDAGAYDHEVINIPLLMTLSTYGITPQEVSTFSQPITFYADAGTTVEVACEVVVSDDVSQKFAVSGYFVDL